MSRHAIQTLVAVRETARIVRLVGIVASYMWNYTGEMQRLHR